MNKIAIDFGTTRTKVAYFDSTSNRPQVIELGRQIRSIVPSLFYIPVEGKILVGDDAAEEAKLDRRGIVRGLKMEIDKGIFVRKNKRKINRIELASILFSYIKQQCEDLHFHNEKITECVLTIPSTFTIAPNKQKAIEEAAELAGFVKIETVEEPIAAAKHWLMHGHASSDFIFVCDIGGGTSDFALLKKIPEREDFQLYTELLPIGIDIGGNNIDSSILDRLDFKGIEIQDRDGLLLQIRQYKEYCCRFPEKNPSIAFKNQRITNLLEIVLSECKDFTDLLVIEIEKFIKKANEANNVKLNETPLLLVGGGMDIYGLKDAFEKVWPGEVILWTESEHATVLGAIVGGKINVEYDEAEKRFHEASTFWYQHIHNINKLRDINNTVKLIKLVISFCDNALQIVDRFPAAFNLKNVLAREINLLHEIEKSKIAWKKNDFEIVIQLCETAIKFYQKDDLPLPAIDYYDEDLITQILLMQAEAYHVIGKHIEAKTLTIQCTERKPGLKSGYILRVLTVLKGIQGNIFEDSKTNWSLLAKTIDKTLTLIDDDWGFEESNISSANLMKIKAYAQYSQEEYQECIITLKEILNKYDFVQLNYIILYNMLLAHVYIKHDEYDNASKLIDKYLLNDDKVTGYIINNTQFCDWIKNELTFTPKWKNILSFLDCNYLLDSLLEWWVDCKDIGSRDTVIRLSEINQNKIRPWMFRSDKLIEASSEFVLMMASVLSDKDKTDKAILCLRDLWIKFPAVLLSEIIKDEKLKYIVLKNFLPVVAYDCEYEPLNNWIRIKNKSLYTLHGVELSIHVYLKDNAILGPINPLPYPIPLITANSIVPPTAEMLNSMDINMREKLTIEYKCLLEEVFPNVRFGGWKYHAIGIALGGAGYLMDSNKIRAVYVETDCKENQLLGLGHLRAKKEEIR